MADVIQNFAINQRHESEPMNTHSINNHGSITSTVNDWTHQLTDGLQALIGIFRGSGSEAGNSGYEQDSGLDTGIGLFYKTG